MVLGPTSSRNASKTLSLTQPENEPVVFTPFLGTPTSTISSSTFSSLPTKQTASTTSSSTKHSSFVHNVNHPSLSERSDSIPPIGRSNSSCTSSTTHINTAIFRFARTPPPKLAGMDDLASVSSSACHTPVIAPAPFDVPEEFAGLSLDLPVPYCLSEDEVEIIEHDSPRVVVVANDDDDDDNEIEEGGEEDARPGFPVWTISGDSNSVDVDIHRRSSVPCWHGSRPSRSYKIEDLNGDELDEVLFMPEMDEMIFSSRESEDEDEDEFEIEIVSDVDEEDDDKERREEQQQRRHEEDEWMINREKEIEVALETSLHVCQRLVHDHPDGFLTSRSSLGSPVEVVYLDSEVYVDHEFEDTPRTTASEEARKLRRLNYDKKFRFNSGFYPEVPDFLMNHFLTLVHEELHDEAKRDDGCYDDDDEEDDEEDYSISRSDDDEDEDEDLEEIHLDLDLDFNLLEAR